MKYIADYELYHTLRSAKHPDGTPKYEVSVDENDRLQLNIKCIAAGQKEKIKQLILDSDDKWVSSKPAFQVDKFGNFHLVKPKKPVSICKLKVSVLNGDISQDEFLTMLKAHRELVNQSISSCNAI